MHIWKQNAAQINNIDTLNWNFNFTWNSFNANFEINKAIKDIKNEIDHLNDQVSWAISKENNEKILKSGQELKEALNSQSETFIDKFKSYCLLLKEYTGNISKGVVAGESLVKIGAGIWTILAYSNLL